MTFYLQDGIWNYYFIYLTHWNLCTTVIAMCLNAYLVTRFHFDLVDDNEEMSTLMKVYWAMWNQSVTVSMIVTTIYWTAIFDASVDDIGMDDVLVHMTNSIVPIIDIFIVNHPSKFSNMIWLVTFDLVYVLFTFVYQHLGGLNK